MSYLDEALDRLDQMVAERLMEIAPFRAIVADTDGNLTTIKRPGADTADAAPVAKATADSLTTDDEVLCLIVAGKPVIIGKVRR